MENERQNEEEIRSSSGVLIVLLKSEYDFAIQNSYYLAAFYECKD